MIENVFVLGGDGGGGGRITVIWVEGLGGGITVI